MGQQQQTSTKKSSTKQASSSPSTNSPAELIDVLNQDVQHNQKVISDLNSQVARMQRQLYNQPDKDPEPVADLLEANAVALEKFVKITSERKEVDHFAVLKQRQISQTNRNLRKYKGLGSYKQKKTPMCPCGEHQGIEFINNDGDRIDHLCPRHWWVMQTWVAMAEKKIGAFVDSTPLIWYLEKYKKEEA